MLGKLLNLCPSLFSYLETNDNNIIAWLVVGEWGEIDNKMNLKLLNSLDLLFIYLFIYFSFIFISWRLMTLQYCSGFFLSYIDMN